MAADKEIDFMIKSLSYQQNDTLKEIVDYIRENQTITEKASKNENTLKEIKVRKDYEALDRIIELESYAAMYDC